MKTTIFLSLALLLMAGCQNSSKDTAFPPEVMASASVHKSPPVLATAVPPQNKSNPFDSAGILHNIVLDYVHPRVKASGKWSQSNIESFIVAYFKEKRGVDVSATLKKMPASFGRHLLTDYKTLVFCFPMQPLTATYLHAIFDTLLAVASPDYGRFKAKVMDIESTLTKDANLSAADKKMLLGACSITRYSAFYWWPSPSDNDGLPLQTDGLIKSIFTALGDVCGYIWGCLTEGSFNEIISAADGGSELAYWTLTSYYGY